MTSEKSISYCIASGSLPNGGSTTGSDVYKRQVEILRHCLVEEYTADAHVVDCGYFTDGKVHAVVDRKLLGKDVYKRQPLHSLAGRTFAT